MIARSESDLIVVWTDSDDTTHISAVTVPIESVVRGQ
jgi:hypothetical protein